MRAFRAVATGALIFLLHSVAQAGPGPRWVLDVPDPDLPHDPLCDKLQKVVDEYFRRHPKLPASCIATALGEPFDMPPWQPIADPGREFTARIEKYSQVPPQTFFADQEEGKPVEEMYFYRADLSKKEGRSFFVWHAKFDGRITPYQTVPGEIKTILQYRSPNPTGGCVSKPDRAYTENLILMAPDLSGPIKLEDSDAYSLLIDASLRLHEGRPILISGTEVYKQLPVGFSPICRFERK